MAREAEAHVVVTVGFHMLPWLGLVRMREDAIRLILYVGGFLYVRQTAAPSATQNVVCPPSAFLSSSTTVVRR